MREILPMLQRLDALLEWAIASVSSSGETGSPAPFRGLYIDASMAQKMLARSPGAPVFGDNPRPHESRSPWNDESSSLAWVGETFGLSMFDIDVLLIALAPELDLRYQRVYSFLQDDVTRKLPTVDLALNLLCVNAEERLARRAHFTADGPLVRNKLLHLIPDSNQGAPALLSCFLKVDEQIISQMLGEPGMDSRLEPLARLVEANEDWQQLPLVEEIKSVLPQLAKCTQENGQSLRLYFQGVPGSGKRKAAEALALFLGRPLLVADLGQLAEIKSHPEQLLLLLFREAQRKGAVLYAVGLDAFVREEHAAVKRQLFEVALRHPGVLVLAGSGPFPAEAEDGFPVVNVPFEYLEFKERRAYWLDCLRSSDAALSDSELDSLTAAFRLTPAQIQAAVAAACNLGRWQSLRNSSSPAQSRPGLNEIFASVRAQCGHRLTQLARKLLPKYAWEDIVLPPDQLEQLKEICVQAQYRHVVYDEWGFGDKLSLGKGLNVLFSGPPGTGKTMAAEVIARELHLDLYRIDLSQIVSKYIGETEKNLEAVFNAAENSNAILFFDEADALFGKRSEVRDSHDRYANIEIAYLLQKMEEYQGISILATNLAQNLDDAFVRRLQAIVEFPFPDETYRRRIWEVAFPKDAPVAGDVDFAMLARQIRLAGGNIRNIALSAAFFAAQGQQEIAMDHLARAARREYQKLGRSCNEQEWSKSRVAVPLMH
ncbi:MAG: ATP-binding protein [Acidobacteriia bacterium]|nr:ATP-binding protein [Terriglobia bacterium]